MARNQSTPEQQSVRVLKVGERVRHILSELLARGEAHDEVLSASNIAVTEVRMTPDLRNAKAYVKPLLGEDEAWCSRRCGPTPPSRRRSHSVGLKFAPGSISSPTSFEADRIEEGLSIPWWRAISTTPTTRLASHACCACGSPLPRT